MSIRENLQAIVNHFNAHRQRGHTTAMMRGATNVPGTIIVTCNTAMAQIFSDLFQSRSTSFQAISLRSLHRYIELEKPVLFDNATIHTMAQESLSALDTLNKQIDSQAAQIERLEAEICRLKAQNPTNTAPAA